jgi:long-subunit acyl-CoA synthetase (AMP-forming)
VLVVGPGDEELSAMSETRRDTLLSEIADKTLVDVFHETCDAHAEVPALVERTADGVAARTWEDYRREVTALAVGLRGWACSRASTSRSC